MSTLDHDKALRDHLVKVLDWEDAHVSFDKVLTGIPAEARGARPDGLPHSAWELLEHLRLAQSDIFDFCRNPAYVELRWPEDYWPSSSEPSSDEEWEASIAGFHRDLNGLKDLAKGPKIDLFSPIPHGSGQTYLREILLVADHNAYHLGQLVVVRQLLGIWP